ncbi:motility protein MotB, partial [Aquitalea sp. S1-19]|nr:motility protein MotB [Aquitalea sp. S1-19]
QNQFSPENRRIAIVILNDDAVDRIRSDGLSAAQHTAADVASEPVATAAGSEH